MTFAEINRARARASKEKPSELAKQVVRHLRERRNLTNERNDLVLLLLACHRDGTAANDAHGRPATITLMRGGQYLSVKIRWGSDGVPRLGPKTRSRLLDWFATVPLPRNIS